jgi:predicted methyltransferase
MGNEASVRLVYSTNAFRAAAVSTRSQEKTMIRRALLCCLALALFPLGQALAQELTVALDAPGRPTAEKARDATSKPMEVLHWIGLEPGASVLDVQAGTGYHTWIFSDAVGPEGHVYSQSDFRPDSLMARIARGDTPEANVEYISSIGEVPDGSLDLVFTDRNYHDFKPDQVSQRLAEIKDNLKPGGLFVVIDAEAAEGRDTESHRIASSVIIDEVTGAGFELVEQSDMLANPDDDHVGPDWDQRDTLDRCLLKFRKPAGGQESHM